MLSILLNAALWIPPILGYGALFSNGGEAHLRRAVTGMLGLYALSVLGMVVHFFVPLGPMVSTAVWLLGVLLFLRRRRWLIEGLSRWEYAGAAISLLALVLLMQPPGRLYDNGLYYLQAVKWASEQPIAIGLVNLYDRLAFNNSWFLVSALLEHPLAAGESGWFVTLLPMAFVAAAAGAAAGRVAAGSRTFPDLAMAALFLPLAQATEGLGSSAADPVLAILIPFILVLCAQALESTQRAEAEAAILLSILAVTIKLSAAPLALGGIVLLIALRRAWPARRLMVLAALAMVPWGLRSILLSGCLFYPVASTCIAGLSWTQDRADIRRLATWIQSWARHPGRPPEEVIGNWDWLSGSGSALLDRRDYLFLGALIIAGLGALLANVRATTRSFAAAFAVALCGAIFWFLTAPDPRFGLGFLFALALLPLAFAASRARLFAAPRAGVVLGCALSACAVCLLLTNDTLKLARQRPWPIPAVSWPLLPVARTVTRTTLSGFEVNIPVSGPRCWAAPLPCAPKFDPNLERDGAIMRSGQRDGTAR